MDPGSTVVILGSGYTGSRVGPLLIRQGLRVITTHRTSQPGSLTLDTGGPVDFSFIPNGASVLISIPDFPPELVPQLGPGPSRVVYLSTTGVYGAARDVDEGTPANPDAPRVGARVEVENAVLAGPWSSLVLRPAAIYGPGRGVHVSLAEGRWLIPGDGTSFVSRIHVDDLAQIAAAALVRPEVTGAYPVADEEPSTSLEVTKFCAELLGRPMPGFVPKSEVHLTRRSDRRVNGQAICRQLGIELRYKSYRTGIPKSLAESE